MTCVLRIAAVLSLLAMIAPAVAGPGFPRGWSGGGRGWQDYDFGTAPMAGASGKQAAYVKAKPGAAADGFGTMTQCISAQNYLGKRLRLSARLRGVGASAVQLWMRVDGSPPANGAVPTVLSFNNMSDHPVTGTTDWRRYDIVLEAPQESRLICYGFFLAGGRGEAWADSFSLETVGKEVALSRSMVTPRTPVNLGFDQ